jgi:hypothetical protein
LGQKDLIQATRSRKATRGCLATRGGKATRGGLATRGSKASRDGKVARGNKASRGGEAMRGGKAMRGGLVARDSEATIGREVAKGCIGGISNILHICRHTSFYLHICSVYLHIWRVCNVWCLDRGLSAPQMNLSAHTDRKIVFYVYLHICTTKICFFCSDTWINKIEMVCEGNIFAHWSIPKNIKHKDI